MGQGIYLSSQGHHFEACKYNHSLYFIFKWWLLQMCKYHDQASLMAAMAPSKAPVQPHPVAQDNVRPTRFRVEHAAFKKKSMLRVLGVDAEFHKYTLSEVSSDDTNILWFWEVRPFWVLSIKYTMTQLLNRPIRKSSPLYSRWLWTTFQSRQHLCLANVCSCQRKRLTLTNETGWVLC